MNSPNLHKIRKKRTKPFSKSEWEKILSRNDITNVSKTRLKDSFLEGIPSDLRGQIWLLLTRSSHFSHQFSPSVYKKLLENQVEEVQKQIVRDVHRTLPEHKMFQEPEGIGQQVLLNILSAYANYDPEVGYCQGMGFIVGCLILQLRDEELAFWTFVQIMYDYNWRLMFKDGTPKLICIMDSFNHQVKRRFFELFAHFNAQDVELTSCFSQYFLTIFLYDTSTQIGLRIFDLFLFEGEKVLFDLLFKILALKKEKLLELQSQDLFYYLRKRIVKECFEEFSLNTLFSPKKVEECELGNLSR